MATIAIMISTSAMMHIMMTGITHPGAGKEGGEEKKKKLRLCKKIGVTIKSACFSAINYQQYFFYM